MIKRKAFTLAEALVTLVILSLVISATMPVVMKSKTAPAEAPWKPLVNGKLATNNSIYGVIGDTSTAVFGDNEIPIDKNIEADEAEIFSLRLNPKLSIITQPELENNPVISRHLIDFYENTGAMQYYSLGKISFDKHFNIAMGKNALDEAVYTDDASDEAKVWTVIDVEDLPKTSYNTAIGQYSMSGKDKILKKETISTDEGTGVSSSNVRHFIGSGNTALGALSLREITEGNNNVAIGLQSLELNLTGSNNIAIGTNSLKKSSLGYDNIAIGYKAMEKVAGEDKTTYTSGSLNTVIGTLAMSNNEKDPTFNTALGYKALANISDEDEDYENESDITEDKSANNANTAIGYMSMKSNVGGFRNVALGANSLAENTSGNYNTAIGYKSMSSNSTGSNNIAIGYDALADNSNASNNIYITNNIEKPKTAGSGNKLIIEAFGKTNKNATGKEYAPLIYGDFLTKELYLNAFKTFSTGAIIQQTSSSDIFNLNDVTLTIGGNTINIGAESGTINIGAESGSSVTIKGLSAPSAQNDAATKQYVDTQVSSIATVSDIRLKNVIGDSNAGLKEILQLNIKKFTMKSDKKKEVLTGVIAQELQKVFPNSVSTGRDGYLRIRRDEIFYALVNSVKELNVMIKDVVAKVSGLDEKIKILEDRNKVNEDKITALEHQNKLLEERLSKIEAKLNSEITKEVKRENAKETVVKNK